MSNYTTTKNNIIRRLRARNKQREAIKNVLGDAHTAAPFLGCNSDRVLKSRYNELHQLSFHSERVEKAATGSADSPFAPELFRALERDAEAICQSHDTQVRHMREECEEYADRDPICKGFLRSGCLDEVKETKAKGTK